MDIDAISLPHLFILIYKREEEMPKQPRTKKQPGKSNQKQQQKPYGRVTGHHRASKLFQLDPHALGRLLDNTTAELQDKGIALQPGKSKKELKQNKLKQHQPSASLELSQNHHHHQQQSSPQPQALPTQQQQSQVAQPPQPNLYSLMGSWSMRQPGEDNKSNGEQHNAAGAAGETSAEPDHSQALTKQQT